MKSVISSRTVSPVWVWAGLVLLLAWRSWQVLHTGAGLHVDEAQYWYWSQDLQWGYYSKPPLLVALIGASTAVLGDGLLGVKFLAMVCWLLASVMLWRLGSAMGRERAGLVAGLLLAASPASGLLGLAATTDAPLVLCWTAVMLGAWRASTSQGGAVWRWWALTGLALGLAVLSKYTALVLSLSALWLVWRAPAAQRLRVLQGALLAGGVAAFVVLPHLLWNMSNGWPTWKHTVDITLHQAGQVPAVPVAFVAKVVAGLYSVADFGLGQLLLLGPAVWAAVWLVLRGRNSVVPVTAVPGVWRPMTFVATFVWPLLLVGVLQALRAKAQVNWSLPALLGVFLWLGWCADRARVSWRWLLPLALVGVVASSAVSLGGDIRSWGREPVPGRSAWDIWARMRGWNETFVALRPALQAHQDKIWVLTERDQFVQTAYELRDLHPRLRSWNGSGVVVHHFDWKQPFLLDEAAASGQAVVYIGSTPPPAGLLAKLPIATELGKARSGRVALQAWLLAPPEASSVTH